MSTLDRVKRSLLNIVRRGQLTRLDDAKKTQNIQIILLDEEIVENVERFQQYGFSSHPTAGDVLCVAVGGKSNQLVSLCVNDSNTRINIAGDDVAVYHKEGHKIVLSKDGKITITCKDLVIDAQDSTAINTKEMTINASTSTKITSPQTTVNGKLTVTGDVQHDSNLNVAQITTTNGLTMGAWGGGGTAQINGSLHATGQLIANQNVKGADFVSASKEPYNTHTHKESGAGEPNG